MPDPGKLARETFAANMRVLRRTMGLSQEQLAARCDLHRTYVGSVERAERNISIDNMAKIAASLDVPLHRMLVTEQP